jgi:hypothetical protein
MKHTEWNEKAKERLANLRLIFQSSNGNGVSQEQKNEMIQLHELEHLDDLKRFGNLLDWLIRLLYKHDPIDLVPCVIPKDEYDVEARMILRELAIRENPNLKEITEIVHQIFAMEFDEHSAGTIDRPCYEIIAKELINHIEEWKNK